ncbi:methionine--tRNA ligase [Streptomyces sp. NPDC058401]|uniref:methionine--tRNA ligase n=1 Tax=Streptomyces sp. NPDC058401 TaxID=3346480 RepID=UPI00365B329D
MQKLIVTATPPTPNGDLHLGHFSGPYLAADVFARHQARRGTEVAHLTGIDDHQSYTESRAVREGKTAEDVAEHFGNRIEQAWADAGVAYDFVARPRRSPHHVDFTRSVFSALYENGTIVRRTRPLPYCVPCDRWAYEAYVVGTCPHCGVRACGNACEVCGKPNDCADLADPECTICGEACELRPCERLYMPLEPFRGELAAYWDTVLMDGHLTALCHQMAAEGLPEIAVSHPADWGIEVPTEGFEGHRIYVWFEMAAGYLAATSEFLGAQRPDVWTEESRVVQFFGFDNGYFHAVLFPAIMRSFRADAKLPEALISNEFYRLDGLKFSTSRQHAIWMLDALPDVPADHLRIHLSCDRPATHQTSFTWRGFADRLGGDLLPRWSDWLRRLTDGSEAAAAIEQTVPAAPYAAADRLLELAGETLRRVDRAYAAATFAPRDAVWSLDLLVDAAVEFGHGNAHLRDVPELHGRFVRGVEAQLAVAAVFAAALYPVAPAMAQQLWSALGLAGTVESADWDALPGHPAGPLKVGNLVDACSLFVFRGTAGGN